MWLVAITIFSNLNCRGNTHFLTLQHTSECGYTLVVIPFEYGVRVSIIPDSWYRYRLRYRMIKDDSHPSWMVDRKMPTRPLCWQQPLTQSWRRGEGALYNSLDQLCSYFQFVCHVFHSPTWRPLIVWRKGSHPTLFIDLYSHTGVVCQWFVWVCACMWGRLSFNFITSLTSYECCWLLKTVCVCVYVCVW
jgi:hypothetical protein